MTPQERFDAVLDHRKPDRMPLYIPTVACSVASELLGYPAHTGGDSLHFKEECSWTLGESAHDEFVHKYREDTLALARKLGVDVARETWRCKRRPARRLDEYTLLFGDEGGRYTVKRYFPETQSYGVVRSTEGYRDVGELKADITASLERDDDPSESELEQRYADQLAIKRLASGEFAVPVGALSLDLPVESAVWLEATALEPELLREYYLHIARGLARHAAWLRGKGYRFVNAGSDIASQDGPLISPRAFERIVEPALTALAGECRRHGMVYCYKSDGNMWGLCDAIFRRAGVQAFGEADRLASMTVGALRARYPGVIALGNVSSVTLATGSARQVREETRATLVESGGVDYVAGPSNAVVHGTPVENVWAMVEEIREFQP